MVEPSLVEATHVHVNREGRKTVKINKNKASLVVYSGFNASHFLLSKLDPSNSITLKNTVPCQYVFTKLFSAPMYAIIKFKRKNSYSLQQL